MYIVRVLKRRDGAALVVGVILAVITGSLLAAVTTQLAGILSGLDEGQYASSAFPGAGWQGRYLFPVVLFLVQLVALEILIRLYVAVHDAVVK